MNNEHKLTRNKSVSNSLIWYEIDPADAETDLDTLAKRIMNDIQMEGLTWKSQYKKEPFAYGICKLLIACVVQDELVSLESVRD